VTWKLVYTKQAQKDAKKLASSGLKPKAQPLLPDNFPTASRHVLKEKQIGHKGSTLWGY
jgi:mRNA-degrading endonuclease RelE of RelBE toxin-antitoxin system